MQCSIWEHGMIYSFNLDVYSNTLGQIVTTLVHIPDRDIHFNQIFIILHVYNIKSPYI